MTGLGLGWKEGVDQSEIYVIIGDNSYFKDSKLMKELEYAKLVKKPFLVFLVQGTIIPPFIFQGVKNIKFITITGKESDEYFDQYIVNYINELHGNRHVENSFNG